MEAFLARLRALSALRMSILISVALACLVLAVFGVSSFLSPQMGLLYGNLEAEEGNAIATRLEAMNVPVHIKEGGASLYVPADQVSRLRMSIAEMGLPSGGSIGYEIFDRSDVLGSNSFVQDINLVRALEGELGRTIKGLHQVTFARVHIVLPKKELFSREKQQPTASVMLKLKNNMPLSLKNTQAIQSLVAFSVPNLSMERISIIDSKGRLLVKGDAEGTGAGMRSHLDEMRAGYESKISRLVEGLLEKTLGHGRVRAEVAVEMDLNRVTEQSEAYDPNGQVVRSTHSSSSDGTSQNNTKQSTITNELPNTATPGGTDGNSAEEKKSEEIVNYEISRTTRTQIKELGGIKRLSVAVLVDGRYVNQNNERTYEPRPQKELEALTKLVRAAVGFQEGRGDTVEVVNLQFSSDETDLMNLSNGIFDGASLISLLEISVASLVFLLFFLFVLRPLMKQIIEAQAKTALSAIPQGTVATFDENPTSASGLSQKKPPDGITVSKQMTSPAQLEALERIDELIEKDIVSVAMVLKNWIKN